MSHRILAGILLACLCAVATASPATGDLRYVTRGKSNRIVIFIDGLQSDPAKSFRWGDGVGSWPELMAGDLAAEAKQLPLARYDTAILSFAGSAADQATVPQLATRALADLRTKGVLSGYESIVFVAHGAGGLVLKSMLVQSSLAGSASLATKTKVVFLLSVPAEGHPAANFLAALAQNQNLAITFGTLDVAVFLQGLESLWSEYLSRRSAIKRLEVYCRSESEASFGVKVAPGQYTTEGCDDNGQEAGTDHMSIARPASRDAGVYRWVRGHLADYFQRFPSDPGSAKPAAAITVAEGATSVVPVAPKQDNPLAPATGTGSVPGFTADAPAQANDFSPAETSNTVPGVPGMSAGQLDRSAGSASPSAMHRIAPATLGSARSGDWTFTLKGADCNLPTQQWVVQLHGRKLTSEGWSTRLGAGGKFAVEGSSACATQLIRGKVSGNLGLGWYLYADPCNAIYCRTRFKMTWRMPRDVPH
jgi:hypothetical protein